MFDVAIRGETGFLRHSVQDGAVLTMSFQQGEIMTTCSNGPDKPIGGFYRSGKECNERLPKGQSCDHALTIPVTPWLKCC